MASIGEAIRKFFAQYTMVVGEYRATPIVLQDGDQVPLSVNQSGQLTVDAVVNVGDISVGIASDGLTGGAVPGTANYNGFIDGSGNLQGARLYNVNTLGSELVQGVNLRFVTAGASVEAGTLADPFHVIVDSGGGGGQSEGQNGAAVPTYSTLIGGTDGTDLQPLQMVEGDTGGGGWQAGFIPLLPGAGGAVPAGTATNPLSVNVLSGGGSNDSVSATGVAVPASATFVGLRSSAGNLIAFNAYANGHGNSTDQLPAFTIRGTRSGNYVEIGTATNPVIIEPSAAIDVNVLSGGGSNSSVSATGAAVPADATFIGGVNSAGNLAALPLYPDSHGSSTDQLPAFVLRGTRSGNYEEIGTATNPIYITGGGGGGSAEGTIGDPAPANINQGGGVDTAGNARPERAFDFDTDAGDDWLIAHGIMLPSTSGPVIGGTASNPISVAVVSGGGSNSSVSATGAAVPADATFIGIRNASGNLIAPSAYPNGHGTSTDQLPAFVLRGTRSGNYEEIGTATNPVIIEPSAAIDVNVLSGGGSNASVGSNGAATPTSSTAIGGTDGTNLQQLNVLNLNPSGGEYGMPVSLRFSNAGGSTAAGTAGAPLRIDPTGTTTQPVSASSLPLPSGAATESTLSTLNGKIAAFGQATMANSHPVVIASNQSNLPIVGAAADDAAASGNPVLVAGKYIASPVAVADGDVVTLRTDDLRNLFCRILGYDPTSDSVKTQEVAPLTQAYAQELVANVAAAGGASGNNYYYLDMTGHRRLALQFILTPGATASLSVSFDGTLQDDLTASASCTYSDMTEEILGAGTLIASDNQATSRLIIIDNPLLLKFLRINVFQSTSTTGGWTIWARKVW